MKYKQVLQKPKDGDKESGSREGQIRNTENTDARKWQVHIPSGDPKIDIARRFNEACKQ